jgi:predicted thioredoxin/glutaredoxin
MMMNIPSITEIGSDLIGRLHGPFSFRFVLQPLMASIFAIRDGVKDAHAGKPAYFWNVVTQPAERRELLREGWHRVLRVVMIGVVMEVLYEVIVFKRIQPLQLVVVVLSLAFVPYLLLRGPVNRIARHWIGSRNHRKKAA